MNSVNAERSAGHGGLVGAAIAAVERGWVPDVCTRWGIRRLCRQRLEMLPVEQVNTEWFGPRSHVWKRDFLALMNRGPIADSTQEANQQHYELPPEFFTAYLGPRRKYSSCWWEDGVEDLATAEDRSLAQVCHRAGIRDGMEVLDLGCGWGSFTLWVLEHYPDCRLTSVSNSAPQRQYIEQQAASRGWSERLTVLTADMNHFQPPANHFDRMVSIEMFEHMRNYRRILEKLRPSLKANGRLFIHIFCHQQWPYLFEVEGAANWMGRYFFTGGMMPSFDQFSAFEDLFETAESWSVNGVNYGKTLDAWLENLDRAAPTIDPILKQVYGSQWFKWRQRWRVFLMASSELFRYNHGTEWFVGHYLLKPNPSGS
jgi:cyclopropane-fatty-acyl-phospholipid synthase